MKLLQIKTEFTLMKTILTKNLQNTKRLIPHTLQSFQSVFNILK